MDLETFPESVPQFFRGVGEGRSGAPVPVPPGPSSPRARGMPRGARRRPSRARGGRAGALGREGDVTALGSGRASGPGAASDRLLHAHAGRPPRFPAATLRRGGLLCGSGGCDGDTGRGQAAPALGQTGRRRRQLSRGQGRRAGQTSRAQPVSGHALAAGGRGQGPCSGPRPLGHSHVAVGAWPDPKDSGTF